MNRQQEINPSAGPQVVATPMDEARIQIARLSSQAARKSLSTWWKPMCAGGAVLLACAAGLMAVAWPALQSSLLA